MFELSGTCMRFFMHFSPSSSCAECDGDAQLRYITFSTRVNDILSSQKKRQTHGQTSSLKGQSLLRMSFRDDQAGGSSSLLEIEEEEGVIEKELSTRLVLLPTNKLYIYFWWTGVVLAVANAFIIPYKMAFLDVQAFRGGNIGWTIVELGITAFFSVDIVLKFFLAYEDPVHHEMVTDLPTIRRRYLSFLFWVDLLVTFPFTGLILTSTPSLYDSNAYLWVSILSLLKLGRLYDTGMAFNKLERSMIISHVASTLGRNLLYVLIVSHVFACIFYFAARVHSFSETTWVGRNPERWSDQPQYNAYMLSM